MKLTLRYFGMIAEATGRTEEILNVSDQIKLYDLKDQQIKKYKIQDPEAVQLVVNQDLNTSTVLKEGDEIAFLPPFAGG
ncbi:MoaD/ThiS family protein [Christiangramia sediminis]|uniref:MoaD/ThiS family protein n=1 Tax=Christiangramia sediminis TaxID=2881336 RepID=A0A9X1LGV7_9FLAO|nr:MoaD/ThiS family protein [Christiangramia sediminis]MCB7480161.1 MoaD/ThiS family protein [Christiangramia sediminis]